MTRLRDVVISVILLVVVGTTQSANVGDYVWCDDNLNGVQDRWENGVYGVEVELTDTLGNVLMKTKTNGDGWYGFNVSIQGSYVVRIGLESNSELFVQPTLSNQHLNMNVNSKGQFMIFNGLHYAGAQVQVGSVNISNIDFGFDCLNCKLSTYLYDSSKVANVEPDNWSTDDDDDEKDSLFYLKVRDRGYSTCMVIKAPREFSVGNFDFLSIYSPNGSMVNSTTPVIGATAGDRDLLSNQSVTIQNYTSSSGVCANRASCNTFNTSSAFPLMEGETVVCVGCSTEYNPAPLHICFDRVIAKQLAGHTIKLHARNITGYSSAEVNAVGILPLRCEYEFHGHSGNDDYSYNDGDDSNEDDGNNDEDDGKNDGDDKHSHNRHGTEIVIIVRN